MKANVKLMGYVGTANIVEETETGFEIEMLEGTLAGKRTFVSKNSSTEIVEKIVVKFSAKITYDVKKEEEYDFDLKKYVNHITGRSASFVITTDKEEDARELGYNLQDYIEANSNFRFSTCPEVLEDRKVKNSQYVDIYRYYDSASIDNKVEFEYIQELFNEWKKLARA